MCLAPFSLSESQGGADQSYVGKSLREISQSLSFQRICFFGVQTNVISIVQDLLKCILGLFECFLTSREMFDYPEAAYSEGPFWGLTFVTVK